MKKELFLPYKQMILRCIESCISYEQVIVSYDMMQRFNEQFFFSVGDRERITALDELSGAYLQKQAEIG